MVPRVTSKGRSFKGAGAYFLHDLGKASTSERVAFTHTVNMLTDDPEKALKVMAWTAEHAQELKAASGQKTTGRKANGQAVYNFVLSWSPDMDPAPAEMVDLGLRSLQVLGVAEHEALFVAHNDTPHKHMHVILNRVHPETGLMATMGLDQNKLSRMAQAYCQEIGRPDLCPQRAINNARRDRKEKHVKAEKPKRLIETAEYKQRRAERVKDQKTGAARRQDECAAPAWQALNDRQTAEREGLREKQADDLARFDKWIGQKYAATEEHLAQRIEEAREQAKPRSGVRGMIGRALGVPQQAQKERLQALIESRATLQTQKQEERSQRLAMHKGQRTAQAEQHELQRQDLARRLEPAAERRPGAVQPVQTNVPPLGAKEIRRREEFWRRKKNSRSAMPNEPTREEPQRKRVRGNTRER